MWATLKSIDNSIIQHEKAHCYSAKKRLKLCAFFLFQNKKQGENAIMKKSIFKRSIAGMLAFAFLLTTMVSVGGTTAFAAGTQEKVYIVSFPRSGDVSSNNGWGHSATRVRLAIVSSRAFRSRPAIHSRKRTRISGIITRTITTMLSRPTQ